MFVNYSMYKKILIILIIYFNGLIANEAKIDSTEFNFEDEYHYDWNKLDEFFEKSIKSKINKLLNPDSFQLIVKLNSNKVDTFKFTIESEDGGDFLPASIISNLTSEQIKVKVYIEESVYNDEIHESVVQIIKATEPALIECDDCIEIESIKKIMNQKSTISLNRDDIYDDSWAVIIGIDKYKYSDQLNYAVKDAEAVKDMLISKFDYPEENIRYLTDEEATLSNIKLNLGEVATSAGEDDRILVFYSGHGETLTGADESETGYIVPFEGKIENLYATGLAMDEILRTCQMSKSKHMLFLMDACYSGLMTENVKSLAKPIEQGYLSKVANEKARQIITAGDIDEQVIERDEWQHSAFTKNLLAGLDDWDADTDNDGYVTADELGTYLRKSVTDDSDFQQTPQKGRFRNSGGGEFVFFSDNEYSPLKYDKDNNTKNSDGVTLPLPSDWGTVSVKDRLKKRMDEKSWSADPTGFGEGYFGCIDSSASNYNPEAYEDDGSCTYIDYKNNNFNYSKCLDIDASVYPDDCISAVHKFGCDYSWGGSLIRDLCSKTCGSCPARIKLSIGDYETKIIAHRGGLEEDYSTIEILIESDTPIAGFQFDVTGVTDIDVSGGMAEEAGFVLSTGANVILGYSLAGYTIPIGKGVLVVLDISSPIGNTFEICIENITLSSSQGELLEFEVDNCKKIK